jgi:hypothetical protein
MGPAKESQKLADPTWTSSFLAFYEFSKKFRASIRRAYLAKPIDWLLNWDHSIHNNVSIAVC